MTKTWPVLEKIPEHLTPFIASQDPTLYTPIDHASWRYILRVSKKFFSNNAHQKYLDGLKETGISSERIPLIEEMDSCLRRFGWRAVAVSGFIPPAVFMEFQSLGVLPIACEMRTLEHLAYTPAPDIVHEAAGHAPIIADKEYANYLRAYGEVARKAIFSDQDMAVYNAIRDLSDTKENPKSTPSEIEACQKRLDQAVSQMTYVSEANLLSRMNWWTVEYGLVGSVEQPKIYGAGLLSSMGESYNCLKPKVEKIPFSLKCIDYSYDITRPQPQLFVTRDFAELTHALEEFAQTMAFRLGGSLGLEKAKQAATVSTLELDSGVQVSGIVSEVKLDQSQNPIFVKLSGPAQIAYQDVEIENQGPQAHLHGFSAPIGRIKTSSGLISAAELKEDLKVLEFESGIRLTGKPISKVTRDNKNIILSFSDCTITYQNEILFKPEWGQFDLACGVSVKSVFGGAADRGAYVRGTGGFQQRPTFPKTNLTRENQILNELYAEVRSIREEGKVSSGTLASINKIIAQLNDRYPNDWLLRLELLELDSQLQLNSSWRSEMKSRLLEIAKTAQDKNEMIHRGLELLQ